MNAFNDVRRQQFRKHYQPTRILLGLVASQKSRSVNVITLCFSMSCSYKPSMMAIALHRKSLSSEMFEAATEFVLAVPGESLAEVALFCGLKSGRDVDKIAKCGLKLRSSKVINTPGLHNAIANIELVVQSRLQTGDHLTVVGEVRRYAVNSASVERNLLSVGPKHEGYRVLAAKGIHRIGVSETGSAS
jgi:flavin reductase (DIM6/NTAB) family NADH-FMN oxidoreductase RutF